MSKRILLGPPHPVLNLVLHCRCYSAAAAAVVKDELGDAAQPVVAPAYLPQFLRQIDNYSKALEFFERWSAASQQASSFEMSLVAHQSSAFEVLIELASMEQPQPHVRVKELLVKSRELGITLSAWSASIVICCFGRVGLVADALRVFLNDVNARSRNTQLYNKMIEVLFFSSASLDHKHAIRLVHEMLDVRELNCRPNCVTYTILLSAFFNNTSLIDIDLLLHMAKKCRIFPNHLQLKRLITSLCMNHGTDKAWDSLHALKELGCSIQVASFNALLTGLGRNADFCRMRSLLVEMKDMGVNPSVITFGILINYLCKSGRMDEALHILDSMISESGMHCKPDIIIFNTVIDGLCRAGRQEEGLALLDKMETKCVCRPNTATYNCLIVGFSRAGEIDKSLELFRKMMEQQLQPNVITLNTIIDGLCKHERISSALDFFDEMRTTKGLKGNAVTCTILIGAFLHANNVEKAMHLFAEMSKSGLSPDFITYCSLISGLTLAGKVDEACSILSSMQNDGFRADLVTYNVLINGFCKKKKFDRAYEVLQDMEMKGIKPDQVTFNTLISALSKDGNFSTAQEVMRQMIDQSHIPSEITYGALIHGFCKANNLDDAMKLFRAMKVSPNIVIYNILINCACKQSKLELALVLMDEMQSNKVLPNITTYNSLFKGLCARNMLDNAYKLMDQMTMQGCVPNYITMEILTEWLSAVGEKAKLRMFVKGNEVSASQMELN